MKAAPWLAALLGGLTMGAGAHADLSDPTRPPDYATASAAQAAAPAAALEQGWNLTSTLVSPSRRQAVINGQVVAPGSRLGHMTVRAISSGRVVLEGEGRREVLTLLGTAVKTPVHGPDGTAGRRKTP